jgi:hypothetical protein
MQRQDERKIGAVIMEAGAQWPAFVHDEAVPRDWTVIPQQPLETPAELALRAADRVDALRREGAQVDSIVIAVGGAHDDEVFAARCVVARALIGRRQDEACLVFSAPARLTGGARHELLALAGTLAGQAQGSALSVSVRFNAEPEQRVAGSVVARGRLQDLAPVVA